MTGDPGLAIADLTVELQPSASNGCKHRLRLDLLLYFESEVTQRLQHRHAVTTRAFEDGFMLCDPELVSSKPQVR